MNAMSNDWADPPARRCPYGVVTMRVQNLEPSAGTSILRLVVFVMVTSHWNFKTYSILVGLRGHRLTGSPDRHPTPAAARPRRFYATQQPSMSLTK